MTTRDAALDAARRLMEGKVDAVGALASALEAVQEAQQDVEQALSRARERAAAARQVYEETLRAGWTEAELTQIGLEAPAAQGGGGRRREEPAAGTVWETPRRTNGSAPGPAIGVSVNTATAISGRDRPASA